MRFKLSILYYLIVLKISKSLFANKLDRLRQRRFKQLRKGLEHSTFYKELSTELENPGDYPRMNKQEFMTHFDGINTAKIKLEDASALALKSEQSRDFSPNIGDITVGLSTGTSGNRGIFLASSKERAKWVAAVLDRVIGFKFKKRSVAFFLRANNNLYEAVNSNLLSFHFLDIMGDHLQNIKALQKINPTILVAQPSMLMELAKAQEGGELTINPSKIISVAEVLTEEDRDYLSKVFSQTIHQVYQCTEGFLASSCSHGTLHFNEDFIHIEKQYIDDSRTMFHPIITDLWRTSQPVINYELNDIVHTKESCPCGSKMMAIEKIEGRSDDIFTFTRNDQEVKIFPDLLRRAIVMADNSIEDYALTREEEKSLALYVRGGAESFHLAKTGLHELLNKFGISEVTIREQISAPFEVGAKKRRIKNDYVKIS